MIVTCWPASPFSTEPDSTTAPRYVTIERLPSSATDTAGVGFAETTAVGTEVAALDPASFDARTRTRSVFPTSADVSTYVLCVAPLMFAQLPPVESQRRHW